MRDSLPFEERVSRSSKTLKNILDKVFVNRPDIYTANVVTSLVKTMHKGVVVSPNNYCNKFTVENPKRKKIVLHDLRQCYVDKLRYRLGMYVQLGMCSAM